jgi:hypothetical protein
VRAEVDRFANTHPQFDKLGKLIEIGVAAGFSLKEAYAAAKAIHSLHRIEAAMKKAVAASMRTASP